MIMQFSPTVVALIICLGLEILFAFIHYMYWSKRKSNKIHLYLSFWFLIATVYTISRLLQFYSTDIPMTPFYGKLGALTHFFILFVGMLFVNEYTEYRPGTKEKLLWFAAIFIPVVIIITSEIFITNEPTQRFTIFGESFYGAQQGRFYLPVAIIRPLLFLILFLRLLTSDYPKEKKYITIGFGCTIIFLLSDMIAIMFDWKWIRIFDFAYVPLGITYTLELVGSYNKMFNRMEELVDERTIELTSSNRKLQEEIQIRKKAEEELTNYRTHLEELVDQRTRELDNSVTEQMQLNETLQSVNEELKLQRNNLLKALDDLKKAQTKIVESEKMAALGLLTAGIAHEINNPLNYIVVSTGNFESVIGDLEKSILSELSSQLKTVPGSGTGINSIDERLDELKKMNGFIVKGTERITEIIQGLRLFVRSDTEQKHFVDIHEHIDAVLVMLDHQRDGRIKIIKEYSSIPKLNCFPGKISQVFVNLIMNSIQAIPDEGTIQIKTYFKGDQNKLSISIKDSGIGIASEIREKIFEPFFTTKDVGQGTGLGLSIVFGIVEEHNGNIEILSEENKGTEFIVTLPI